MGRKRKKRKKRSLWARGLTYFFSHLGPAGWLIFIFVFLFCANFTFQVFQKPTEALAFLIGRTHKSPAQTWRSYEYDFRKNSTKDLSPTFLAALAQIESGGDPLASPPWAWNWSRPVKKWFAPASSSVGLYQFTTGTFKQAQRFCIQDNKVVKSTVWFQPTGCWFNRFYLRFSAADSIEMASAYLTHSLSKFKSARALSLKRKERLAAIIHLCGFGVAKRFARRLGNIGSHHRCGTHSIRHYLRRLERAKAQFERLART